MAKKKVIGRTEDKVETKAKRKKREKVELEGQLIRYHIILIRVPGRDYKNKIKINKSIKSLQKRKKKKRLQGKVKERKLPQT